MVVTVIMTVLVVMAVAVMVTVERTGATAKVKSIFRNLAPNSHPSWRIFPAALPFF